MGPRSPQLLLSGRCVQKWFTGIDATGVIGVKEPSRYGMGCFLKNSHIIGLALKSVTP